eukprot:8242905-Pyramimonas_sp.AAC.1
MDDAAPGSRGPSKRVTAQGLRLRVGRGRWPGLQVTHARPLRMRSPRHARARWRGSAASRRLRDS